MLGRHLVARDSIIEEIDFNRGITAYLQNTTPVKDEVSEGDIENLENDVAANLMLLD